MLKDMKVHRLPRRPRQWPKPKNPALSFFWVWLGSSIASFIGLACSLISNGDAVVVIVTGMAGIATTISGVAMIYWICSDVSKHDM